MSVFLWITRKAAVASKENYHTIQQIGYEFYKHSLATKLWAGYFIRDVHFLAD